MYVCMYICMCVCVCIYIYSHTHTYVGGDQTALSHTHIRRGGSNGSHTHTYVGGDQTAGEGIARPQVEGSRSLLTKLVSL